MRNPFRTHAGLIGAQGPSRAAVASRLGDRTSATREDRAAFFREFVRTAWETYAGKLATLRARKQDASVFYRAESLSWMYVIAAMLVRCMGGDQRALRATDGSTGLIAAVSAHAFQRMDADVIALTSALTSGSAPESLSTCRPIVSLLGSAEDTARMFEALAELGAAALTAPVPAGSEVAAELALADLDEVVDFYVLLVTSNRLFRNVDRDATTFRFCRHSVHMRATAVLAAWGLFRYPPGYAGVLRAACGQSDVDPLKRVLQAARAARDVPVQDFESVPDPEPEPKRVPEPDPEPQRVPEPDAKLHRYFRLLFDTLMSTAAAAHDNDASSAANLETLMKYMLTYAWTTAVVRLFPVLHPDRDPVAQHELERSLGREPTYPNTQLSRDSADLQCYHEQRELMEAYLADATYAELPAKAAVLRALISTHITANRRLLDADHLFTAPPFFNAYAHEWPPATADPRPRLAMPLAMLMMHVVFTSASSRAPLPMYVGQDGPPGYKTLLEQHASRLVNVSGDLDYADLMKNASDHVDESYYSAATLETTRKAAQKFGGGSGSRYAAMAALAALTFAAAALQ